MHELAWFIHGDARNDFSFETKLGQGAYGEVTLVSRKEDGNDGNFPYQKEPGERFAVKQVQTATLLADLDLVGAFKQECELQLTLVHPNVCALYAVYSTPKVMYMVCELVDGGDLFDGIMKAQNNILSEEFAARVIRKSCEALAFMHENGVAHRDIKPENIMLLNDAADNPNSEVVKLGDFGFAIQGENHMLQTTCGSPQYIAPEVLEQRGYNHSCDIWSLGVVAFQILYGFNPFSAGPNGQNVQQLFTEIRTCAPAFPKDTEHQGGSGHTGGVTDEARDLIENMLQKSPDRRLRAAGVLSHEWVLRASTPGSPWLPGKKASYKTRLHDKYVLQCCRPTTAATHYTPSLDPVHFSVPLHSVCQSRGSRPAGRC